MHRKQYDDNNISYLCKNVFWRIRDDEKVKFFRFPKKQFVDINSEQLKMEKNRDLINAVFLFGNQEDSLGYAIFDQKYYPKR